MIDACALVPITLTNTLLWLAEAGVFEVLWSDTILDEVRRNLPKLGVTPERAAHRVETMREAFGAAALVDAFEHLIPDLTCDPKDRHVLAAAVRGEADCIVTFNLKDFPPESTEVHGIEAVHPDMFLLRLLVDRPADVVAALERGSFALRRPAQTLYEFLASLTTTVPMFANLAADAARDPQEAASPVPALVSSDDDAALSALGEPGDLTNPAQVVSIWWSGILGDLDLARALTFDPAAWDDYQWAIDHLVGRALASKVIPAVDAPGRVAFMRFIPEVATAARVFASYTAPMTFVTVVRIADDTWRVWGLGPGTPSARDVLGDPDFVPGGGTSLVFEWLTRIVEPDPPVELIWSSLDQPLRLANAQSWLLATGKVSADDPQRDRLAEELAAREGSHPFFQEFFGDLVRHYQDVYRTVDGRPCIVGLTETVGPDLELVSFSSEEHVGTYDAGVLIPAHAFITRHVGDGEWVIAANARRMPVSGWPPTEQVLPGLQIEGN